jgi:hypothetical protein
MKKRPHKHRPHKNQIVKIVSLRIIACWHSDLVFLLRTTAYYKEEEGHGNLHLLKLNYPRTT